MTQQTGAALDRSRRSAGLTHNELWLRYFALGGMSSALELEDILSGAQEATPHDHNVIAHALNERFVELGGNHPVPYSDDEDDGPDEA
jgi:hypothetical protein